MSKVINKFKNNRYVSDNLILHNNTRVSKFLNVIDSFIKSETTEAVAEGEEIEVNDSAEYLAQLDIEGNTTQDGTPTPDTPVKVKNVTGLQKVEVCGKNLANINRERGTFIGNGTQFDENYFYPNMTRDGGVGSGCEVIGYINNVLTIKGIYDQGVGYPIKCIPNTQYCVKAKSSNSKARLWVNFYDNTGNFISGSEQDTDLERIVTTPNNAYWLIVVFGVNGGSFENVNYSEIQIEKGSQATDFIPHKEQIYQLYLPFELCKIGDYKDYIFKENNKWYKHKVINKELFDGTQTITRIEATSTPLGYYYTIPVTPNILYKNQYDIPNMMKCSNFRVIRNYASELTHGNLSCSSSKDKILIGFDGTTEELQQYFANNNTTVYYVLETPVDEEITNTTLIQQLNELENAMSYYGTTYVDTTNEVIKPILKFTYNRSNRLRIENLEKAIEKGQ